MTNIDELDRLTKSAVQSAVLVAMMDEVVEIEIEHGWSPNDNRFPESLALLHSEVSEALEAFREIGFDSRDVHPNGEACPGTGLCKGGKPDDVASELADVFIRLLSTWAQFLTPRGFNLAHEVERKHAYNRTREYRHGGKSL